MSDVTSIMTAEQLFALGDIGRTELLRGELIRMSPAGFHHGGVAMTLAVLIGAHVRKHKLGTAYAAETGFILTRNPDTVRTPDVAFVRAGRIPPASKRGFFPGAPD